MIQIMHLREKCIGCNSCVENAPVRWSISSTDGKSDLKDGIQKGQFYITTLSDDEYEDNKRAADDCPMHIISVVRVGGKK